LNSNKGIAFLATFRQLKKVVGYDILPGFGSPDMEAGDPCFFRDVPVNHRYLMHSQKLTGWLSKNFVLQGLVFFHGRRHTSRMSRS
jgi:hypothetical protein